MKKLKAIMMLYMVSCLFVLSSCSATREQDSEEGIKQYCEQYVSQYEVLENGNDDTIMVSITAPDFGVIVKKIVSESDNKEVTIGSIKKKIEENPECIKKYSFSVNRENNDEIKDAFLRELSKDLIVDAIKNSKYNEDWSVDE